MKVGEVPLEPAVDEAAVPIGVVVYKAEVTPGVGESSPDEEAGTVAAGTTELGSAETGVTEPPETAAFWTEADPVLEPAGASPLALPVAVGEGTGAVGP